MVMDRCTQCGREAGEGGDGTVLADVVHSGVCVCSKVCVGVCVQGV